MHLQFESASSTTAATATGDAVDGGVEYAVVAMFIVALLCHMCVT